jgi:hypothetical protein
MSIMNTNQHPQLTRRLAGHDITLTSGAWYIATRPMATRGRTTYPVSIRTDAETFNDLIEVAYAELTR